jgi:hypothetical protein
MEQTIEECRTSFSKRSAAPFVFPMNVQPALTLVKFAIMPARLRWLFEVRKRRRCRADAPALGRHHACGKHQRWPQVTARRASTAVNRVLADALVRAALHAERT